MGSSISTLSRTIPKILYAVEGSQINVTSVEIKWVVSEKNPVDGLAIWEEGTTEEKQISLEDASAGQYTITGLTPRTTYYVALTNSAAPEGAEKYNQQRFTTAGMPADAVVVEDGVDYYLTTGGEVAAKTSDIKLTKSIALLANPGERPTLYIREGGFIVKPEVGNMPNIEYFIVDNVNIKETWTESKPSKGSKTRLLNIGKHNTGTDFTIDRFEITNSDIVLPSTGLMMSDASEGVTTINHIRIDNCLVSGINDTKNVTKQFGFIHAINKGSNVWNDVSVTNSTFYEFYISPGVFGAPTADIPIAAGNKVVISNCTFYNWGSNKDGKNTYRAVGNFSKLTAPLNLSVSNCVFGSSKSKVLDAGSINLNSKVNYCTLDFEKMSDAGLTLISLDTDDASLFRNVEENDFTVVDAESVIYKSEYGDPRWIKVLD